MLATLVPLFDENMAVSAYSLFSQKENMLLEPRYFVASHLDGACNINGLEIIESMGMNTIASDREIFVPVNNVSLFADIEAQCSAPKNRIVIFIDNSVKTSKMYVDRIEYLKSEGYKIAIWKLDVNDFELYRPILLCTDYVFLNYRKIDISKAKIYFSRVYPNIKLIAGNIQSQEDYESLTSEGGYQLYEGPFYRMPVTKGAQEIAPLKINYIELLNIVNDPNFDLTEAADVIGRDTSLVIDLLAMVNRMTINSEITTIRHAAAMLGQKELAKWITTAVAKQLCSDKPSEITRVSLLRAKFAENLAPLFKMKGLSQELFLLGLFSVLDIILDKTMKESLEIVKVSENIRKALVDNAGEFAPILNFIREYESAGWQEVSRIALLNDMKLDDIYEAYCQSLVWYRQLFFEDGNK